MDVLGSRILLHPVDPAATHAFYRDTLGLAVAREFGPPENPGVVYFAGPGLIEVSGRAPSPAGDRPPAGPETGIWLQVRDVAAEHRRLRAAGARIVREPRTEPWGLVEMWLADPDGRPVVLVQIPADHPLRRDQRTVPVDG